jgi:3',5'-cyclic AMP phosphodiesterase CpdA
MNRRSLLKSLGIGTLSSLVLGKSVFAETPSTHLSNGKIAKRYLRFAHLTDVHMQPELDAPKGLASCLHHVQSQADKPTLIVNTGDCIMDALKQPKDRVVTQWNLWHQLMKDENSLPIAYCIGNHDCWGAAEKKDPLYGKNYALEMMHLERPYRSFDQAGWHFVVLDSIQVRATDGQWYACQLDDEQFEWLGRDLEANKDKHTVILSHAPILSAAPLVVGHLGKIDTGYQLGGGAILNDAERVVTLFTKHPQVKLALSGHIHLNDEVKYQGVTYISNGAVSGNWWKGDRYATKNGYAIVDLYEDGTFDNVYVPYGWKV